ncbi:restriction endonuclease [Pseudoalteromonas sp. 20-92]|uniref:restriction endonuclease n=1 Tax=Pseudoalteromonas sp. 20-92 TaxID=2969394 RepID=UPI0027B4823E|nr:restriction endonuclease [Pseudoalteromonas sp. 20-92]MDQ2045692.1 restriction endonuclease [Pseudoalteromonas sp. 20-92]
MKKILDYSQFLQEDGFQDRDPEIQNMNSNRHLFYNTPKDICPFCKISTSIAYTNKSFDRPDWLSGGFYEIKENVSTCSSCGWWRTTINKETTGDIDAISVEIKNAVLRKYDLSGKDVPIQVLETYLSNKFEDVIHIHDQNMEKLVQSVFSEHFDCDVTHMGKSGDGGIDLFFIDSEKPNVVQVKRRKKLKKTESVSFIREFLGAALLKKSKNLIYVSTADKFSTPAVDASKEAVSEGIVESYELYNFSRFEEILKLYKSTDDEPAWKSHIGLG